ncbi:MAG: hypothetical protein GY714_14095 [Desulfobacterales bacterium]|nr:hypothetical protein [Desulfobacterales bacterium]
MREVEGFWGPRAKEAIIKRRDERRDREQLRNCIRKMKREDDASVVTRDEQLAIRREGLALRKRDKAEERAAPFLTPPSYQWCIDKPKRVTYPFLFLTLSLCTILLDRLN